MEGVLADKKVHSFCLGMGKRLCVGKSRRCVAPVSSVSHTAVTLTFQDYCSV